MKYNPSSKNSFNYTVRKLYKVIIFAIAALLILNLLYENSSLFYRKLFQMPFSLHLNKQDIVLTKGEESKLYVFGVNKRVSYSSTNFRVAGVNFNGRVHAYRVGKTYIIAKVDGKELKCRVRVIDLNKEKLNLKVGETFRLRIAGNASFPSYKSNNPEIATVNWLGKIEAKKEGKAVITVKVKGKLLRCNVTVKKQ